MLIAIKLRKYQTGSPGALLNDIDVTKNLTVNKLGTLQIA